MREFYFIDTINEMAAINFAPQEELCEYHSVLRLLEGAPKAYFGVMNDSEDKG